MRPWVSVSSVSGPNSVSAPWYEKHCLAPSHKSWLSMNLCCRKEGHSWMFILECMRPWVSVSSISGHNSVSAPRYEKHCLAPSHESWLSMNLCFRKEGHSWMFIVECMRPWVSVSSISGHNSVSTPWYEKHCLAPINESWLSMNLCCQKEGHSQLETFNI